ncbi:MAG: glycosyltransferase family 2 protein [Opitutales bacterium]|jgi:glycosyltransferase involved in cell wall biosynthesis
MLVSFIIPSYNQGRFIQTCLDGIAAQSLPPGSFETLVYDAGSTDETIPHLRAHPLHPRWISEPDSGQAAAVNRGLREARGDVIAWINADDFYRRGALAAVLAAFAAPAAPAVVYGRADIVDESGLLLGPYPVEPWNYARLADLCFLCQPAVFFRRSVFEQFGPLDERLHLALDYEYWLRVGRNRPFHFLDRTLAATRDHPATKSRTRRVTVQRESLLVSHRHTGRWSRKWARGLAKHEVRARLGLLEDTPHLVAHLAELAWWRLWQFRLWSRDLRGWTDEQHSRYFSRP